MNFCEKDLCSIIFHSTYFSLYCSFLKSMKSFEYIGFIVWVKREQTRAWTLFSFSQLSTTIVQVQGQFHLFFLWDIFSCCFFLIFAEDTGEVSKWFYWKLIDWTPPFIVLHVVLCELLRTSRLVDLWTIKHFDHCLPCVIITLLHLKQFCPLLNSPRHVIVSVHKQ